MHSKFNIIQELINNCTKLTKIKLKSISIKTGLLTTMSKNALETSDVIVLSSL